LPSTTSARRIGRGRMASNNPDSISIARAGAARKLAPIAITTLNMKAIRIKNAAILRRASSGENGVPSLWLRWVSLEKPQAVSPITNGVRMKTVSTTRRRIASNTVSRAIVSTGGMLPSFQQVQESLLQGMMTWLDRVDAGAHPYQARHQIRYRLAGDAARYP